LLSVVVQYIIKLTRMSYTLKTIRYHNEQRKILLQNENGPCPLLAAANALLLRGVIALPPSCLHTNAASTEDIVNTLAERALSTSASHGTQRRPSLDDGGGGREYQINELLGIFPGLQFGMDVNPRLTRGVTGVEYTKNLTAFDLMGVELVHGWLVDSADVGTIGAVGGRTYNELVESVVSGVEAANEVDRLQELICKEENELDVAHRNTAAEDTEVTEVTEDTVDTEDTEKAGVEKAGVEKADADNVEHKVAAVVALSEQEEGWISISPSSDNKTQTHIDTPPPSPADTQPLHDAAKEQKPAADTNEDVDLAAVKDFMHNLDNDLELDKRLGPDLADATPNTLEHNRRLLKEQQQRCRHSAIINAFLTDNSNQLTVYGLAELHSYVQESATYVFFRNNHFATITKEKGLLYLLVTDLGYANVNEVVWEKLDDVTGDTEYMDHLFQTSKPRSQSEVDYQIALQISRENAGENAQEEEQVATAIEASMLDSNAGQHSATPPSTQMNDDNLDIAKNVQNVDAAVAKRAREDDAASEVLARRLQAEENEAIPDYAQRGDARADQNKGSCIIS